MLIAIRSTVAITGLLLVLFVLVHLAGLVPALLAPHYFEAYATALHHSRWLPLLELGLAATTSVHIILSLAKSVLNRQSGNNVRLVSRRHAPLRSWASRSKLAAGLITLAFLSLHLQQLRWPRPGDGRELELLSATLSNPLSLTAYIGGSLAVALHLLHGAEAAHRSLGWLDPSNARLLRSGGLLLAVAVGGGFLLICLGLVIGATA